VTADAMGNPACRTTHAAANIEYVVLTANTCPLAQDIDSVNASVMILIKILECVLR
jgi:hypothetical protein